MSTLGPVRYWYYVTSHLSTRITTLAGLLHSWTVLRTRVPKKRLDHPARHRGVMSVSLQEATSRVHCGRLTRAELHRLNGTPAQAIGRHAQDLGAIIPMRTTRNIRSSCEPSYKISACPPLCKPVSATKHLDF